MKTIITLVHLWVAISIATAWVNYKNPAPKPVLAPIQLQQESLPQAQRRNPVGCTALFTEWNRSEFKNPPQFFRKCSQGKVAKRQEVA